MDDRHEEYVFKKLSEKLNSLVAELADVRMMAKELTQEDVGALWWMRLRIIFLNDRINEAQMEMMPLLKKKPDKPADIIMFPGAEKEKVNAEKEQEPVESV